MNTTTRQKVLHLRDKALGMMHRRDSIDWWPNRVAVANLALHYSDNVVNTVKALPPTLQTKTIWSSMLNEMVEVDVWI